MVPAVSGKLIAKGRQIKLGKTLGYAEAEVTDVNGKILTHGTSTVILLPGQGNNYLSADPPLPPKFIIYFKLIVFGPIISLIVSLFNIWKNIRMVIIDNND